MVDAKLVISDAKPVVACDLASIPPADRARYRELRTRLLTCLVAVRGTSNGFVVRFCAELTSVDEVSEWFRFESLCCPWMSIRIRRNGEGIEARMSMPPEGKRVVKEEFQLSNEIVREFRQ